MDIVGDNTESHHPLLRSSKNYQVRIMRPAEWEVLREALDPDMQKICTAQLLTGTRYAELERIRDNPNWIEGSFVYLPHGSMLKEKAKQREREIRLSDMGKIVIQSLYEVEGQLPALAAYDMRLMRMSGKVLDGHHINNKSFRKTWESWLVFYYPDRALQVALSQGHASITQYMYYLNLSFDESDRKVMRKWVEGWA